MGKMIYLFLRHTWLYLYSTRTVRAMVLSQKKNLGEHSEHPINEIMTLNDSSEDHKHFIGLCDQSYCATSSNVSCG